MLNLYNSLTKSLEKVELSSDEIKIYLCGPTVQSSPAKQNKPREHGAARRMESAQG